MGKIKLNLVSGAVVEKPLINAFKANNNSYIVLDNEMNGSMGLPIILVCKYENNKLTKILDQNEWGIVKEYLKNIIAGNQIEFISINNELVADDIYYTQLTLPVPSFDALKNAYKVPENTNSSEEVSIMDIPTVDVGPNLNTNENASVMEPVSNEVEPMPSLEVAMPEVNNFEQNSASVIDIPVAPQNNLNVENQTPAAVTTPISPVDIVPPVNPVLETPINSNIEPETTANNSAIPGNIEDTNISNSIFSEQKEAFMQACENMFDALVQKFERELENRK